MAEPASGIPGGRRGRKYFGRAPSLRLYLVGMNLFLSSYRFGKPMPEVTRATMPMLGVLAVGVLLITYVPLLTTWLPRFAK